MHLTIRLSEVLKERGMTQKQLSELTGIRPAAISEICNNQRTSINREHIEKIADCLGIQDVRDIIRLEK